MVGIRGRVTLAGAMSGELKTFSSHVRRYIARSAFPVLSSSPGLEPSYRICDWDSKQDQQVRNRLALLLRRSELGVELLEDELVRLLVVDLVARPLCTSINAEECHPRSKTGKKIQGVLGDVGLWTSVNIRLEVSVS